MKVWAKGTIITEPPSDRIMNSNSHGLRIALLGAAAAASFAGSAAGGEAAIDPEADRLLRAAGSYLADAKAFSVNVEVWKDVTLPSGQKIQTGRNMTVNECRPGQLRVEVRSPRAARGFWLRDRTLTMLDRETNLYGVMEVPEGIDGAIDTVEERFGISIPVGDVLVADPYRSLMQRVVSAEHFGKVTVQGVVCEHLAFTGENADFQVWIADGSAPLVRKIVIDLKKEEGSPQITQLYTGWDLTSPISDSVFTFVPPEGAEKIEVTRAEEETAPPPVPTEEKAK